MTVNKEVWILAEQKDGELEEITLELVSAGRKIADKLNNGLCAVIFGDQLAGLADNLARYSLDRVYAINDSLLRGCTTEAHIEAFSNLIKKATPEILLCGATLLGSDIAAGLAARLETGLASDCTYLDVSDDGLLLATRPVYDDRLQVVVVCPVARPQIATIRPGIEDIKLTKAGGKAKVITIDPQPSPAVTQARVIGHTKADLKTVRLDRAEVIVAGGRGIGGPEGFRTLEELAELLGGCIGASLVATDNGWVSDDKHIGQTGVVVGPRLYVAVGISGSIYHTMGMKDSKLIVAINRDRNAPIFSLADMGIVGDWREVVSATISCLGETEESAKREDLKYKE